MATQSTPSPNQNQQIPGLEEDKKDVLEEASNPGPEKPAFANPDPIREDQVQNAVRFLSHPKVRGSPVAYRRSFLENKGLTKEEIDESFRRVPDASPSSGANVAAPVTTQVAQPTTYTTSAPAQVPQPMAVIAPPVARRTFNWYHIVLATSILAATGAGSAVFFKRVFVPRVKAWIRRVVSEKEEKDEEEKKNIKIVEEVAEAAKAAASAAALVAEASQDILSSKNEDKGYFEAFMRALDVQVKEMKAMGETIKKLESRKDSYNNNNGLIQDQFHSTTTTNNGNVSNNAWGASNTWTGQRGTINNGDYGLGGRPSNAPLIAEPVNPKSYMEMMSMGQQQRGEKPPALKPWETTQRPTYAQSHSSDEGSNPETLNHNNIMNTDASSEPWWRKKPVKVTEPEPESDETKQQQFSSYNNNAYGSGTSQRRWVPPQTPAVVMPEAVAAIRQPKNKAVLDDEVVVKDDEAAVKGDEVASFEAGGSSSSNVNEIVEEEINGNNEVEVN